MSKKHQSKRKPRHCYHPPCIVKQPAQGAYVPATKRVLRAEESTIEKGITSPRPLPTQVR